MSRQRPKMKPGAWTKVHLPKGVLALSRHTDVLPRTVPAWTPLPEPWWQVRTSLRSPNPAPHFGVCQSISSSFLPIQYLDLPGSLHFSDHSWRSALTPTPVSAGTLYLWGKITQCPFPLASFSLSHFPYFMANTFTHPIPCKAYA